VPHAVNWHVGSIFYFDIFFFRKKKRGVSHNKQQHTLWKALSLLFFLCAMGQVPFQDWDKKDVMILKETEGLKNHIRMVTPVEFTMRKHTQREKQDMFEWSFPITSKSFFHSVCGQSLRKRIICFVCCTCSVKPLHMVLWSSESLNGCLSAAEVTQTDNWHTWKDNAWEFYKISNQLNL